MPKSEKRVRGPQNPENPENRFWGSRNPEIPDFPKTEKKVKFFRFSRISQKWVQNRVFAKNAKIGVFQNSVMFRRFHKMFRDVQKWIARTFFWPQNRVKSASFRPLDHVLGVCKIPPISKMWNSTDFLRCKIPPISKCAKSHRFPEMQNPTDFRKSGM